MTRTLCIATLASLLWLTRLVAEPVLDGAGLWAADISGGNTLAIRSTETGDQVHLRPLVGRDGTAAGAAALIAAPVRRSFLLALDSVPELWEIALFPEAGPFHEGFVHSYTTGAEESLSREEGMFARQRIMLSRPLIGLTLHPDDRFSVLGTRADGSVVRIHLAVRLEIELFEPGTTTGGD